MNIVKNKTFLSFELLELKTDGCALLVEQANVSLLYDSTEDPRL